MKRLLIVLLMCGAALPAMAFLGMPIADDANTRGGLMRVTGSLTFESDVNLFGGRFTFGVMDDLAVFGGVGIIDPDTGSSEPYFQLGGIFRLPADLPVDLAVRGAFGYTSYDERARFLEGTVRSDVDVWTVSLGTLASMPIDEIFILYGFGGLSYQDFDYSTRFNGLRSSGSDSELELVIAGGVIYMHNENMSFFGELANIDDLFLSVGVRFEF